MRKNIPYDMIIGRDTLRKLGIILDFDKSKIDWKGMKVEMKDPTFFEDKEKFSLLFIN